MHAYPSVPQLVIDAASVDPVDLPTDYPRRGGSPRRPATAVLDIGDRVAALALGWGVEPAVAAAAVFAGLLYRHTRQESVTFTVAGTPLRNVRMEISGARDIAGLARQLAAVGGEDLPVPAAVSNVHVDMGGVGHGSDDAELVFRFDAADSGGRVTLEYDGALFSPRRVREWLQQWALLMAAIADDPRAALDSHALITTEAVALLPDPAAPIAAPPQRPLFESILEHAATAPRRTAVVGGGREWTYGELAATSAGIAHDLVDAGVRAEDTVAVTGPRGFAFVASMLGVMRSGGVLVSLDPALPEDRRRVMAAEAGARVLVNISHAGDAIEDSFATAIGVDADGVDAGPRTGRLPDVSASQSAYVFFTSGSTGVPKGVRGEHRGLSHFLDWQRREFGIGPDDRASQLTALSFDVMLRDTFMVLTAGGTLCIPGEQDVLEPARILRWLRSSRVSVLHVVPSLARMWLNHVPQGLRLPDMRRVFFAGEPLLDQLVERWREAFGSEADIVNLYGPTETTLAKCFRRVDQPPERGVQSIGGPIPNTQVLILNPAGRQCGLYEAGEIVIRTPFRTRGYINNPEAAAKAFRVNPLTGKDDDIVYYTGDSGRYRGDGALDILGRIDNQVKIRGVRIEPGEVEAAIARFPGVVENAVVAIPDESGEKYLAAYVVPHGDAAFDVAALRGDLRRHLPENLVPSAVVVLDALPLNPNGKVNRRALPAPGREAFSGAGFVAPEDELQADLAAVWERLLGIEGVGIDDDFFDLGGHSLMAVQLVHAIGERLGQTCTLTMLFRTRTIRLLADEMAKGGEAADAAAVLPLQPEGEGPPLFCLVGIHLYQQLADALAPRIPVYGIFLPQEERMLSGDGGDTTLSMEEMAGNYREAIVAHQPEGPYYLLGVSFGGVLAFELARQLRAEGREVAFVGILDSMLPEALRRNWLRWAGMHLGQLVRRGPSYLLDKLRRRLAPPAVSTEAGAATVDMGAVRGELYRRAERAYAVPYYDGGAVLVRAEDQSWFGSDVADATYGWSSYVADLTVIDTPGGHLSMLEEPHVARLAEQLIPHILKVRG